MRDCCRKFAHIKHAKLVLFSSRSFPAFTQIFFAISAISTESLYCIWSGLMNCCCCRDRLWHIILGQHAYISQMARLKVASASALRERQQRESRGSAGSFADLVKAEFSHGARANRSLARHDLRSNSFLDCVQLIS